MSDLTALDKRKLEELLGMATGYVLDFSNRSFGEFVRDSTGRDIFDPRYNYASGSKANRLRAFWHKEDNHTVSKLMEDLLGCCPSHANERLYEECRRIVMRLQNGSQPESLQTHHAASQRSLVLARMKDEFLHLAGELDRGKAGLALERLLNHLFALFDLQPRQPFRVVGEQIDGSFVLDGQIYLLESKWEKHPLPEADLLIFRGKIEGKSSFTRGVFIALNDVSQQAREAITRGKAPAFFVMNGHDLLMVLSGAIYLPDYLRLRVRRLAEEGRVCLPFAELC